MSECVYSDVNFVKDIKRGERVERVVEFYGGADGVGGHNPKVQTEDTDTKRNVQPHHAEKDAAWSRCYRLTAVCVVLLCVLLLTAVTLLWIKFNNLKTENNQLQKERDEYLRIFCDFDKVMCFNSNIYFMSNEKKSWTESRQNCKDKGADLVIINSKEEQDFIVNQLKATQAWIGLSDRDKEGEWRWVDGTTLLTSSFSNWASSQPDDYNNKEDCGDIWSGDRQHWNDSPCDKEQGWICEKRN